MPLVLEASEHSLICPVRADALQGSSSIGSLLQCGYVAEAVSWLFRKNL